ncbi:hypothetical protein BJ912DRAFT_982921 [Pholiota molesta]|nr:hypothetical protein BJ912DRAFT_982921 [Pholiota molesta]
MSSFSNTRAGVDSSKPSEAHVPEVATSSNPQAQMLLTALHNVVVPLIKAVMPDRKDSERVPVGPEADAFLAALQKYITCIIRDHSQSDNQEATKATIQTVHLEGHCQLFCMTIDTVPEKSTIKGVDNLVKNESSNVQLSKTADLPGEETFETFFARSSAGESDYLSLSVKGTVNNSNSGIHSTPLNFDPLGEVLSDLRAHVFNDMPIRLLCIQKTRAGIDSITLLDRAGIYSYLASEISDRFRSQSFRTLPHTWVPEIAVYAILSHTWLRSAPGEVTYKDWHQGAFDLSTHAGYRKLVNFCKVAMDDHEITLGWMDTVCINKESSAELDESIRSMYKWYRGAKICITYLGETTTLWNMNNDPWFTRGWTLQELLAPQRIKFYGKDWSKLTGTSSLNDKEDSEVQKRIKLATTITAKELISPATVPISRKMHWAAKRQVTRGEDAAYSLMGIFDVNMSIAYGEGAKLAFVRLLKEILSTKSDILDIFNWAGNYKTDVSALLPSSPVAYARRYSNNKLNFARAILIEPLALTHLGLRIPVLILPAAPTNYSTTTYTSIGDYYATVKIYPISIDSCLPDSYDVLDVGALSPTTADLGLNMPTRLVFAILNCRGDETNILIPKNCLAVAIVHKETTGMVTPLGYKRKVSTEEPIIFRLRNKNGMPENRQASEYDAVERSALGRHGMHFLTMYL